MAYFRTLKSGQRQLIYTARDRQIQIARRANNAGRGHRREYNQALAKRTIAMHYALYNGQGSICAALDEIENDLRQIRRKLVATLKWERRHIWSAEVHATGYVSEVRRIIVELERERRYLNWLLRDAR